MGDETAVGNDLRCLFAFVGRAMKFSVVVSILNEENSVGALIDTLINQSSPPVEIIFVDAGSSDNTVEIIRQRANVSQIPIKYVVIPGCSRSKARNEGIKLAKSDYIAITDAGCEADHDWLKFLAKSFVGGIEAVGGFYLPIATNKLQRIFSFYTCTDPVDFDKNLFLPSSRSIAFSKQIWQQVGGYPEDLNTCEDLVFAKLLKNTGKMISTNKAIVYWRQSSSIGSYFKQIAGYSRGDIEAVYWPHVIKIIGVYGRYLLMWLFPLLTPFYLGYPLIKFRKRKMDAAMRLLLPPVQLVTDLAVMWGGLRGLWSRLITSKNLSGNMTKDDVIRE